MLTNAPSQPRNPSRKMASSAKEPSRTETLSSARRSVARRDAGSRLRNRTEYFLSETRARMMGMPWAPVPPMTKTLEVVSDDIVTVSVHRASQTLNDRGVGHAAALTHRLQPVPTAALLERVDQRGHNASAAGTQRMPDGDRAAVHVRLGQIGPSVFGPGQHHRGERLVDLEQVDVGERQARAVRGLFGGRDHAGQHVERIRAHHGGGVNPGQRTQAQLLAGRAAGNQYRGTTVRQRRRVTGRDLPIDLREALSHCGVVKSRLEPGEGLDRGTGTDDLVGAQPRDRGQLVVEESFLGRPRRFLMAGGGELVEFGSREAPAGRDEFSADALWHQAFGVTLLHASAERVAARQDRGPHRYP